MGGDNPVTMSSKSACSQNSGMLIVIQELLCYYFLRIRIKYLI